MKTIKITQITATGFDTDFDKVSSVQIADDPFAEGGFGRIYHCKKINNKKFTNPQVIKIFKDNGQGSAAHSYKTISSLQKKLIEKKNELAQLGVDFLDYYPAFFGAPQFVFEGEMDGEIVQGYSANNLIHFGYICFTDVLNNSDNRDKYFQIPIELVYAKAYHLSRGFSLLNEFSYIHADFKTDNFFVSINEDGKCALIDFDSGAIIENLEDDTYTWGTPQDMLAPEIFEQLSQNEIVRVNLFSDMWSVAIANHYLMFCMHPLFFLNQITRNSVSEYNTKFDWPLVDKQSPLFKDDEENSFIYDWYCSKINELPKDIYECFKVTVTKGYNQKELRTTYNQWSIKLESLIPLEEKRYSLSKIRRRKEREDNPEPQKPEFLITEEQYPDYISDLVLSLIEKRSFLYEHKEKLEVISSQLSKLGLYDKVDKLLITYYEIIADGIINNIERNKFSYMARSIGVKTEIIEKILKV
jgi:serine/threonine protein kinase